MNPSEKTPSEDRISRRDVIRGSAVVAGVVAATQLPMTVAAGETKPDDEKKLKVVVVGGHPDDPESGCGGTMAKYAQAGHDVVALYLTSGQAGVGGKSFDEAAKIRQAEGRRACEILDARAVFASQVDSLAEVNRKRYAEFRDLLLIERPDVVLTHWPLDTHRDHRAASMLTYDAWLASGRKFSLYYYEVLTGSQTQQFHPTDFVDITEVIERKRAALMAHASQNPTSVYAYHDKMQLFRGMECGCKRAEAFVQQLQTAAIDMS